MCLDFIPIRLQLSAFGFIVGWIMAYGTNGLNLHELAADSGIKLSPFGFSWPATVLW